MAKKFPKRIFVKIAGEGEESYFDVSEGKYGLAEMGEKIKIATYDLVEVENVEVVLKTTA